MPFELIASACSASSKEPEGEDRARVIGGGSGLSGVIVCDGVGSIPGSGSMAEEASELATGLIGRYDVGKAVWNLDRRLERDLETDRSGATTIAVVCADEDGVVGHLLVGNGGVLELTPMEIEPGNVRMLWTSIALPQMGGKDGRPALRSFLPPRGGRLEAEKGVRRAPQGTPRLYLACSDGFFSEEERREGPAPDGTVWRQVPPHTAKLLELLPAAWGELREASVTDSAAKLDELLDAVVRIPELVPLDDDTTVGAIYMRPAPAGERRGAGAR